MQTADGTIVDPTAGQFPGPVISYEPWKAGDKVRVGKCMECGEDIWKAVDTLEVDHSGTARFCNEACEDRFIKHLYR